MPALPSLVYTTCWTLQGTQTQALIKSIKFSCSWVLEVVSRHSMATGWQRLALCLVSSTINFGGAQDIFSIAICTNRFCNCTDTSDSPHPSCAVKQGWFDWHKCKVKQKLYNCHDNNARIHHENIPHIYTRSTGMLNISPNLHTDDRSVLQWFVR